MRTHAKKKRTQAWSITFLSDDHGYNQPKSQAKQHCHVVTARAHALLSAQEQATMNHERVQSNYWSQSDLELARNCRVLAESRSTSVDSALKAEARNLYAEWCGAINFPDDDRQERVRRAALLAALRKRTIQILVKVAPKE
jgi:hypothetical protein